MHISNETNENAQIRAAGRGQKKSDCSLGGVCGVCVCASCVHICVCVYISVGFKTLSWQCSVPDVCVTSSPLVRELRLGVLARRLALRTQSHRQTSGECARLHFCRDGGFFLRSHHHRRRREKDRLCVLNRLRFSPPLLEGNGEWGEGERRAPAHQRRKPELNERTRAGSALLFTRKTSFLHSERRSSERILTTQDCSYLFFFSL